MKIVYASRTNMVATFVEKIGMEAIRIRKGMTMNEPYVLITYTTGFGEVPEEVQEFLKENHTFLRGVAASGNQNWGNLFAKSADIIAEQYRIPIISKFELSGTKKDVEKFKERVQLLCHRTSC